MGALLSFCAHPTEYIMMLQRLSATTLLMFALVTHRAAAVRKQWFKATVDGRHGGEPFYQCFEFESGVLPNPEPHHKSYGPQLTRQKVDVIHLKKDWHAVNGAKDTMYGEPVLMFRYKDGKTVADQTAPPISHLVSQKY